MWAKSMKSGQKCSRIREKIHHDTSARRPIPRSGDALPRSDDAPHAVLTPLSLSLHTAMTPLTPVPRPSHAAVSLPRFAAAAMM